MRTKILIAAIAAVAVGFVLPGTASAAPNTLYCLNGVSTTLPAAVGFTGGSSTLTEGSATLIIGLRWHLLRRHHSGGRAFVSTATGPLDPGYSTNFVGLGSCTVAFVPSITYVSVCKYLIRSDGQLGFFQQIRVPDWNEPKGQYFDAPAANWVEGLGLTCDNPLLLGYKATGTFGRGVASLPPTMTPRVCVAPGFNNIYPYFTR